MDCSNQGFGKFVDIFKLYKKFVSNSINLETNPINHLHIVQISSEYARSCPPSRVAQLI